MRIFFSVMTILGLVVSLGGVIVAQDTAADEEAIAKMNEVYTEAWNNRDAKTIAAMHSEDADSTDFMGETVTGRMAIEEAEATGFAELPEGAQIEIEQVSLRFVRPSIAVADGTWTMTGIPEGAEGPPSQGLYTVVFVKEEGEWLVSAARTRVAMMPSTEE